ncbi:hypothetical protein C4544_01240 [candidate division WS5 bacterium]|uniref:Uncharacterized protein n=1 Tax=candidate division WS5 bacterium TaxID=2093353 RepID=A0A419DFW9_9BACT|nr:MAG: hypothetical protein C4544_01240 [candidate division WS5 bacterium]
MNIFKSYTFTWWQAGILKASVVCIGIAIGANWPEVFAKYTMALIVVAVVLGIYLAVISFKK